MEQQIETQDDELLEFVTARQRELEEQQGKKQKQWQEQGLAQDQEQSQGDEVVANRLQAERDRLHQAVQQDQGQGEAELNQNEKAELAAPRAGMQGGFASNQLSERAAERREFEQSEGNTLMVCDVKPEEVQPLAKHEQAADQQKNQNLSL